MNRAERIPHTLTIEQVAGHLGISRTLAYQLASTDRLPVPTIRLGRRLVVSRVALERLLDARLADPTLDQHLLALDPSQV